MRLTRQIIDLDHKIRIKQIINYNFKSTQMMNDEIKKK
jgi:hypothetical protein